MSQPRNNPYLSNVSKNYLLQTFKADETVSLNRINDTLEKIWDCGRNTVIGWAHDSNHVDICYAPVDTAVNGYRRFPRIFQGNRLFSSKTFNAICSGLDIPQIRIKLSGTIGIARYNIHVNTINNLIKRYCITYTDNRAVILFDIVKFSLKSPTEQLCQLKTLEYYIDKTSSIMANNDMPVDLHRSTTGDGYYIWNNNVGHEHNIRTYIVLAIMLTLNAVNESRIPLRSAFAIGSHFTYHHVDTLPRGIEYIVGDVTIKLSRIVNSCTEDQLLIGYQADDKVNIIEFMSSCQEHIDGMSRLHIYTKSVIDIRTYLTGYKSGNGFEVQQYCITDKHGLSHPVCNVKLNVYFYGNESVRIGKMTQELYGLSHLTPVSWLRQTGGSNR
jgi:hypothetical protein